MKQFLVKIKDKSRINELEDFGKISFVSKYSSVICFDCDDSQLDILLEHPIVESVVEAPETIL